MSFKYWNPSDNDYNDQMIYDQRYFDWVATSKYRNNERYPISARGYPRMRYNLQLRRNADVYRNKDLMPNGAARAYKLWNYNDETSINYMREVYPPNYYEMYG